MSSKYPILDNKRIDQWKVVELKEELKKRKLTTKGLKDDLVKRLAEAVRVERENAEIAEDNHSSDEDQASVKDDAEAAAAPETVNHAEPAHGVSNDKNGDDLQVQPNINDSSVAMGQEKTQDDTLILDGHTNPPEAESAAIEIDTAQNVAPNLTDSGKNVKDSGAQELNDTSNSQVDDLDPNQPQEHEINKFQAESEDLKSQLERENPKPQLETDDLDPKLETDDPKPKLEIEVEKPQMDDEDLKSEVKNEDLKPLHDNLKHDISASNDQVSEVSRTLGFQAKSDSISTDSVSINEKNELKDNIIADNVKLELDVVKPEMVELSSSNVVPVGGESHPMDVEEPHEKKSSVEEVGDATVGDVEKKIDTVDLVDSEKLNLDRSSGDDSMDEDTLEIKQIDSKDNSEEVGNKTNKVPVDKVVDILELEGNNRSADQTENLIETKSRQDAAVEKRKLNDQETVSTEPLKRQRRWNSESIKTPELQTSSQASTLTHVSTMKDTSQPPSRNLSQSDSTVSNEEPKERVVPPSQKPPSTSLKIDRFVRPFTLKAVQELLGKTGNVTSFWMDHIKTHCFVTYSSVEEAVETRNAVYNLQWPPNGGRLLAAEFVDPQEVKSKLEAPPPSPATPVTPKPAAAIPAPITHSQPSPRLQPTRQQLPPPPPLPPPPALSNPPPVMERLAPPPPPPPESLEPPIMTLDDLFRKTKATPRIYYLPLSDEQVAAKKRAQLGKQVKQ